jgi:hypothetical protein
MRIRASIVAASLAGGSLGCSTSAGTGGSSGASTSTTGVVDAGIETLDGLHVRQG